MLHDACVGCFIAVISTYCAAKTTNFAKYKLITDSLYHTVTSLYCRVWL